MKNLILKHQKKRNRKCNREQNKRRLFASRATAKNNFDSSCSAHRVLDAVIHECAVQSYQRLSTLATWPVCPNVSTRPDPMSNFMLLGSSQCARQSSHMKSAFPFQVRVVSCTSLAQAMPYCRDALQTAPHWQPWASCQLMPSNMHMTKVFPHQLLSYCLAKLHVPLSNPTSTLCSAYVLIMPLQSSRFVTMVISVTSHRWFAI